MGYKDKHSDSMSENFGVNNERPNKSMPIVGDESARNTADDLRKILEASAVPDPNKSYLDLETAKAVMEKVTIQKHLPSTTNVNTIERWELIKLRVAYHYSANPVLLIIANSHMELNRSLTFEPTNVLSGLFRLGSQMEEVNINSRPGRWARFKQLIGGQ